MLPVVFHPFDAFEGVDDPLQVPPEFVVAESQPDHVYGVFLTIKLPESQSKDGISTARVVGVVTGRDTPLPILPSLLELGQDTGCWKCARVQEGGVSDGLGTSSQCPRCLWSSAAVTLPWLLSTSSAEEERFQVFVLFSSLPIQK